MDLYIYAIQELRLIPRYNSINETNVNTITNACDCIIRASSDTNSTYDDLCARYETTSEMFETTQITWRPTRCLDAFLYISDDQTNNIVGITTDNPRDPVEFFSTCSDIDINYCSNVVFLGHLTSDYVDENTASVVFLIYDVILQTEASVTARYNWLNEMSVHISRLKIGSASCHVQWIGNIDTLEKVKDMVLPHKHNAVVVLEDNFHYTRHIF